MREVYRPVRQAQPHVDLGIGSVKPRHIRGDQPAPQPERRRHKQRAARVLGDLADLGLGLVHRFEDPAGTGIEHPPLFGGLQHPRRALKQPHPQMILQM